MSGEPGTPAGRIFPATAMPDRDWWQALWPHPTDTLRRIGVAPGMRVVDLCCGDGYFTAPLARLVAPGELIAIDLDPEMLRQARAEVVASGAGPVTFLEADVRELPRLVSEPADLVLLANTFHGVPDKAGLAGAVRKVLRPSGWFVIVNWLPLPREETPVLGQPRGPRSEMRMAPEAVAEVIGPAGFAPVEAVALPPYHYALRLQRA